MTTLPRQTSQPVIAGSGIGQGADWEAALGAALDAALDPLHGEPPSLLVLFASDAFSRAYSRMLDEALKRSGAPDLVGCSASGVIGVESELEGQPAVSVLALRFPDGALLGMRHVTQPDIQEMEQRAGGWVDGLGLRPDACTGLIVVADPYSVDIDALIRGLERDYPGVTLVGGLASGTPRQRGTSVFAGSKVWEEGAVVIALGGSVGLQAVVSQGCEPIGEPWTVTDVERNVVRGIGNRPAYEVLAETIAGLSEPERNRVARNLLVGLAMDEYRTEFKRGDFLIRNFMGVDPSTGAVAVAALPKVGQTIQFQVRDARAADEELRHLLEEAAGALPSPVPAALLFACNGRGVGLFGEPHHDIRAAREVLGPSAIAGFFCNGEIGPVGRSTYVHGFTASLGLFVSR